MIGMPKRMQVDLRVVGLVSIDVQSMGMLGGWLATYLRMPARSAQEAAVCTEAQTIRVEPRHPLLSNGEGHRGSRAHGPIRAGQDQTRPLIDVSSRHPPAEIDDRLAPLRAAGDRDRRERHGRSP